MTPDDVMARGSGYGCDASAPPPEPARQIDGRVADCVTIETRGALRRNEGAGQRNPSGPTGEIACKNKLPYQNGQSLRRNITENGLDAQRVEITARNDRAVHPAGLFGGHIREKILISGALTLLTNAVIAYNRGQAATLTSGRPLRYWPGCPAAIEFSLKSPLSSD